MNCRSAESLFSALIEDELCQEERRALEAHLLGCRRCSLSVRELRESMSLVRSLPAVGVSPHFEEDVLARVRSGEGLRPSVLEWLRGAFVVPRLRPVLTASAGLCAAAVAVVVLTQGPEKVEVTPRMPSVASVTESAPVAPESAPSASIRPDAPGVPSGGSALAVAAAPSSPPADASPTSLSARRLSPSEIAKLMTPDYVGTTADSGLGGRPLEAPYQDEYILDQFLLERAPGQRDPSMVPVGGSPNDDVYIEF